MSLGIVAFFNDTIAGKPPLSFGTFSFVLTDLVDHVR